MGSYLGEGSDLAMNCSTYLALNQNGVRGKCFNLRSIVGTKKIWLLPEDCHNHRGAAYLECPSRQCEVHWPREESESGRHEETLVARVGTNKGEITRRSSFLTKCIGVMHVHDKPR